jgi:hypothetical protein
VAFCFLLLYLWLMGRAWKVDWTVGYFVMIVFTMSINSAEPSGKSLRPVLLIAFTLLHICKLLLPLCALLVAHGSH